MAAKRSASAGKAETKKSDNASFSAVFEALKEILKRHAGSLRVTVDKPDTFTLETLSASWKGKPLYFASAAIKKNYVSYYFMPIYMCAPMQEKIGPVLKKHMQGKACFNFTSVEPAVFEELRALTDAGVEFWKSRNLF